MRTLLVIIAAVGAANVALGAEDIQSNMNAVLDNCLQQYQANPKLTRVERVQCMNDGMTKVYTAFNFPYMDLVYQFEASQLSSAASADAGKITQDEFAKEATLSMQLMNSAISARAEASRQTLLAQQQEQQRQYDNQRKALIAGAIMGGIFKPQPLAQPYVMPTNPSINCTSIQTGTMTSTSCH